MAAVSIIIPVYNVEDYIDRCMESIVNQSFYDIEIILINDGSTDKSDDKCVEWLKRDNRIKYISEENQGPGPSKNLGIETATSEFVAFCDSDDWFDLQFIERMLRKQQEDNADIVVCGWSEYDEVQKKIIRKIVPPLQNENEENLIMFNWKLPHILPAKLLKKTLFTDNDIKMPACLNEDTAIHYYLMTVVDTVSIIQFPLYFYAVNRPGSVMSNKKNLAECTVTHLTYSWELFKKAGLFEQYKEPLLTEASNIVTNLYEIIKANNDFSEKWIVDVTFAINEYFGDLLT